MLTEPAFVREVNRILAAIDSNRGGPGGASVDDKIRKGKAEELSLGQRARQGMLEAHRRVQDFAQALIPIPTTLGQLVRQSTQAASPGAMSTLQKSWQLVMMQVGRVFLPAILTASKALQDFAEFLKKAIPETRDAVKNKNEEVMDAALKSAEKNPEVAKAIAKLFAEKTADPQKRTEMLRGMAGMNPDQRKRLETVIGQHAPDTLKRIRELMKSLNTEAARRGVGPGGGGRMSSGSPLLHDIRPPGYQASYQGFEEARRNLQTAALNQTPLDIKIMQEELEITKEILRWLQENMRGSTLPPQKGR